MGRLIDRKGFECLIKAFAEIEKKFPDYSLIIFGEGPERGKLENVIKELNLSERVSLPGIKKKAIEDIAKSSVFVLSSEYEGMPNALIEAMASGVPCISTDCPMGPSELINSGENGFLVPVNDYRSMAELIEKVLLDKELSKKLSNNAVKINQKLSQDIIFEQFMVYLNDVYKEQGR